MKPRIMRAASRPTAKAEPANFVGTVLSDPVFAPEGPSRLRASRVSCSRDLIWRIECGLCFARGST